MKAMKKLVVVLLCLLMLLPLLPSMSLAASDSTNLSCTASKTAVNVGEEFTVAVSTRAMTVTTFTGGVSFDPAVVEYVSYAGPDADDPEYVYLTRASNYRTVEITAAPGTAGNTFGLLYPGTADVAFAAQEPLVTLTFRAKAAGDAKIKLYEDSDGEGGYYSDSIDPGFTVTVSGGASTEGYLTYNGVLIPDDAIVSCMDDDGIAMLTDVLDAASIGATGDCYYTFTSSDGYTTTLDADQLAEFTLFDNDGTAGAPYSWRNGLKGQPNKWYSVGGLATITTGDHAYDAETHQCTNPIGVGRNTYEPCGAPDPAYGYLLYNGKLLTDEAIVSCMDESGIAMLTDVLDAAGIEPTGDCYYTFTSSDGYTTTLDADQLADFTLFDNDGTAGAPYSWRNGLKGQPNKWYSVTGLATITSGDHAYDAETHQCTKEIKIGKFDSIVCGAPDPAYGYLLYNGKLLTDEVIASCLDADGNAPLTQVLEQAGIEPTGDCYYTFTSSDGYTATLDADLLQYMVLFDNNSDPDIYAWRNSLTAEGVAAAGITGGWYKVTGLTTIVTGDHNYDPETHLCTNPISVSRGVYEPCGAADPAALNLTFGHNCEFISNIALHYLIPKSELAGYDSFKLHIQMEKYAAGATAPTLREYTLSDGADYTIDNVEYYHFVFPGINIAEMGNKITATVIAVKDGEEETSVPDVYSVADFAYNRLADSDSATFKTFLVDMLNFGAAAQTHFNVNKANLVNADLTEEQQALGSQGEPELTNRGSVDTLAGATAVINGKNLVFDNSVLLRYRMDLSAVSDLDNVYIKFTCGDTTQTVAAADFGKSGDYYTADCTFIAPSAMRSIVTAVVYDGDTPISDTVNYSIETYVYNRLKKSNSDTYKDLITKMMFYGISAETHFLVDSN